MKFERAIKRVCWSLLAVVLVVLAFDLFLVGYGWAKAYF